MTQDVETLAKTGGAVAVLWMGLRLLEKAFDFILGREKRSENPTAQFETAKSILQLAHAVEKSNQLIAAGNQRMADGVQGLTDVVNEMRRELNDHRAILTRLEAREKK